jgi:hypothetical protein
MACTLSRPRNWVTLTEYSGGMIAQPLYRKFFQQLYVIPPARVILRCRMMTERLSPITERSALSMNAGTPANPLHDGSVKMSRGAIAGGASARRWCRRITPHG